MPVNPENKAIKPAMRKTWKMLFASLLAVAAGAISIA